MPSLTHVDTLNTLLLPVLANRVETLGDYESGAYNFYLHRLTTRNLLSGYDHKLAELLVSGRWPGREVHEIGSGLNQLPFLLALNGVPSVGFEFDKRRYETGALMRKTLVAARPEIGPICRFIEGPFPPPAGMVDPAGAIIVSTNLVATTPPDRQTAIVAAMKDYAMAIVDIDRLFEKRDTDASRAVALGLFEAAGFQPPEPITELASEGTYMIFRPPA